MKCQFDMSKKRKDTVTAIKLIRNKTLTTKISDVLYIHLLSKTQPFLLVNNVSWKSSMQTLKSQSDNMTPVRTHVNGMATMPPGYKQSTQMLAELISNLMQY